ncbi:MAG TPA: alpha/beta fold hydrolase [Thermoleophilaceae bacterium]|nr:alpha/beta fold hydrolase [Thermoleophilaceae bacterium]
MQAAVDHWAPRFVQAGVDYSDFVATTAGVERWEEWHGAWCRNGDMHAGLAAEAESKGRRLTAGEAWARATVAYHFAKFVWMVDPQLSREAADRAVAAMAKTHEFLDPAAERIEVPLDGGLVVGNLRRPRGEEQPPLVLLVPGLDSTKEEFFRLENVFLDRGMATLSMDGPGQGESGYDLPIRPDYDVAVAAVLDALAGRSDVDLDRVGLLGVSLGGYYAPRVLAFEPRVKAGVGLSGPYRFGDIWETVPPQTRETFVFKSFSKDEEEGRRKAGELDLAGVAERIEQPYLAITGRLDRLIPWEQTERAAREAPKGEFLLHEDGNHGCANVPYKTRPVAADWLREQLG